MSVSHVNAFRNTAIGRASMATGACVDDNTGVGYNTLNLFTGSDATAVGSGAADSLTTGASNTAVGKGSLATTDDGANNVAVGVEALGTGNCVDNNTALGFGALYAFTGSNATAVGSGAADAATSAAYLTAVGTDALGALPTGAANTAVGYKAFATLDNTETRNVALGAHAGRYCDATDDCVAIGYGALSGATWSDVSGDTANGTKPTGHNNVAIGSYALDAATTETGSTAIGKAMQPQLDRAQQVQRRVRLM